ncbi:radial spoke head 14 homolog [Amphiprion ocellaris]|uniref:Condensin complex subunit 1 C-terminal domain-containing protein n=1 Tax=Amphiprion ocellaris TaxID=80972 RepID=A0A3Q1AY53_AMPOC|nr:radial spoke head 14 homolog [Amphiprion ocellaris]
MDSTRAPVAFGRWDVPLLFGRLQQPEAAERLRSLASLCDLMRDPERLYRTVTGGFLEQLQDLLKDEDPSVRSKTCELLHLVTAHSIGRQAVLSSSLLPSLSQLLDDSSSSSRINALRALNCLALLPAGADALLCLVPKLMLKLQQQDGEDEDDGDDGDEEEVLLLSTISCCSRLDALPALASDGVSLLGRKLTRRSPEVRREAAASLMELSIPVEGKRQVCEGAVLPVLVGLLQDEDVDVRTNAAGVVMNVAIITAGKLRCLDLDVVPVLLDLLSKRLEEDERSKALVLYSLRALTALAEAPDGRRLLLQQLPLLARTTEARHPDIRRAAQTAVRVVTWTP